MNKLVQALVNAGLLIKQINENQDGVVLTFSADGQKYRLICAKDKPVPRRLMRDCSVYCD